MKCLSSIFSFNTLTLRGLRPWGALLALGILLAVEFGVARQPTVWFAFQESPVWVQQQIEQKLIKGSSPRVAVLGNSRIQDMILPGVLADSMGLAASDVVNAAITEGTPFDCLNIYRRNRDIFRDADILIIGQDSWQCRARPISHERVRRYATLEDRLELFTGPVREELLVGYFWRTLDAHKAMLRGAKGIATGKTQRNIIVNGRSTWNPYASLDQIGPEHVDGLMARARSFYANFEPGDTSLRPLRELAALAREDDTHIVFCRAPLRTAFHQYVVAHWPEAEEQFEPTIRQALTFDEAPPTMIVYKGIHELGMPETYFADYGHLLPRGAVALSQHLGRQLKLLPELRK